MALTTIFSYLLYRTNYEQECVPCQLVVQQFLCLNRLIHESFALNEPFWMWYNYYVYKCEICYEDAQRLHSITKSMIPNPHARCCFWKKECEVQSSNRRLCRQWSIKFSNRVLINRNIPIVESGSYHPRRRFNESAYHSTKSSDHLTESSAG